MQEQQTEPNTAGQPAALNPLADLAAAASGGERSTRMLIGGEHTLPDGAAEAMDMEGSAPQQAVAANNPAFTAWLFQPGAQPAAVGLDDLPALVADDPNFVWIDLSAYQQTDLRAVGARLNLPDTAQQDAIGPWQRPTMHLAGDQFYVTVTVARIEVGARRVQAGQLDLFVGPNFLVSAHKQELPFVEHVFARAQSSPQLLQLDSAFMLYLILDELIAYYERLTERMEDEIEQIEERALSDDSDKFLAELLDFKRYIFAFVRLVDQHRPLIAAFLRPDFPFVQIKAVEPYYRDLGERLNNLIAMLTTSKEAANNTFNIYISHVSHRTNHIIKMLTQISTVLFTATAILALFGTNFQGVPLYGPLGFVLMIIALVVVCGAIVLAFRRNRWL